MPTVSLDQIVRTTSTLWDQVDLLIYYLNINSSRPTSEELYLKSTDMSMTLSTFKSRLEESVDHMSYCDTQDDELWETFKSDMNNLCSLLKNSFRITFVDKISCTEIDRIAVNLNITAEAILSDWTADFSGDDFEVDRKDVWGAYMCLVSAHSLFSTTKRCEESLALQYKLNIEKKHQKVKKKCAVKKSTNKKAPRGVTKVVRVLK